jgi:opacity protein-like surface antigen
MRFPLLVAASVLAASPVAAEQAKVARPAARTTTTTTAARTVSSEKTLWYGPHASFADEADLGLGARAHWSFTPRRPLALITSFDYFFPSAPSGLDARHWEVNGNMAYQFGRRWRPYVGPGVNLARRTASFAGTDFSGSDTSLGMNVLGGVRRVEGRKRQYFAEARYEVGGGEQFLVTAGVLF